MAKQRKLQQLAVPKKEFLEEYWNFLVRYRGRLAVTILVSADFSVTIPAKVINSHYFMEEDKLVFFLEVGRKVKLELHLYLKGDGEHYISGLNNFPRKSFQDRIWDERPISVYIAD